jgi:hypothetical protein
MASTNDNTNVDTSHNAPLSPAVDPKRKVSILADPPQHHQAQGYDNPAFDGPQRKISAVRFVIPLINLKLNLMKFTHFAN